VCPCVRVSVCPSVRPSVTMQNGSLDLAARAFVLQAFLFHLAIQDAATEVTYTATDLFVQRRARYEALNGKRTLRLFRVNASGSIAWRC
jgi:hypothetical protein